MPNNKGSIWQRWEPHIHMPGTLKEDKYGANSLEAFIKALNDCNPPIKAIGITDYSVLDSYERLLKIWKEGKLPGVELIFPNIELRYPLNVQGSPINVHLIVCPDDPDHIEKTNRFLADLKFEFNGEKYGSTKDELIRLGNAINPDVKGNTEGALKLGVNQSKISPDALRAAVKDHKWARENILIATAAGQQDGVAQLQDAGLTAIREELQRMSNFIFSSRPGDRTYWLGQSADSIDLLKKKYNGPKPCIHGSDAHELLKVGAPDLNRYCWIKGDLTFESLRQICLEPESRVFIGDEYPSDSLPSETINKISVSNAHWLKNSVIPINKGLVAVIGARGSGKTALVEMIAAGAGSLTKIHAEKSFIKRAAHYLGSSTSELTWGSTEVTTNQLTSNLLEDDPNDPRVRYLSQQFVDKLCGSDGLADDLVAEIERVIFIAHPPEERLGTRSFQELREIKTDSIKKSKNSLKETLKEIGDEISIQDDLKRNLESLKQKFSNEKAEIDRLKKDRQSIAPKDNSELVTRLDEVREATEKKSQDIAKHDRRKLKLISLKDETEQFENSGSKIQLDQLKSRYEEANITAADWGKFQLKYKGDVMSLLASEIQTVENQITSLKGVASALLSDEQLKTSQPFIKDGNDLSKQTHFNLKQEQRRLEILIGIDQSKQRQYHQLSERITKAESSLEERKLEISKSQKAPELIKKLLSERENTFKKLVELIEKEESLLNSLYKPLQERLAKGHGSLKNLSCSIKRIPNLYSWSEAGEQLLDRSRIGPFKGVGTLSDIIKTELSDVWAKGNSSQIASALSDFRNKYRDDLWKHAFEHVRKTRASKKAWYEQVSNWLYSTDHIEITYGLKYNGVQIEQLSPGTRGIVLLLLYLSLDTDDRRPLIIDQPEENLDPKSISTELVERFREAKKRRQIIIVTHNANLVVNTDAEQVIVANAGDQKSDSLPDINYFSGGLENPDILKTVRDILEGGSEAFKERARRLRIKIS